jgi:hypothetical protein
MSKTSPNSIDDISPADWDKTPESVKWLVKNLIGQISQRIGALEEQCTELKAENQLLKEQIKLNSKNSSKSPSQGLSKGFKPKPKEQGKKKLGG